MLIMLICASVLAGGLLSTSPEEEDQSPEGHHLRDALSDDPRVGSVQEDGLNQQTLHSQVSEAFSVLSTNRLHVCLCEIL